MSQIFTGNFMFLKSSFLILPGSRSTGFKYLSKHYLKHSISSIFWILINHFLGWSNLFGNLM